MVHYQVMTKDVQKKCLTCSTLMYQSPREGRVNWDKRNYCTMRCYYDRNLGKRKQCGYCDNYFSPKPREAGYKFDVRRFCSIQCVVANREKEYQQGKSRPISTYLFPKGEDNPNWRGGVTPINEKIRKLPKYKAWRKSVFERDDYTCVWCGTRGGDLNADHIKPFAFFEHLRFDINNGRTLCVPCHRKTFFGNKYEHIS